MHERGWRDGGRRGGAGRDAVILLGLYWRLDRRESGRAPLWTRLLSVIMGALFAAFSAFMGFGAGLLVHESALPIHLNEATVPGLLLTIALMGLIFTGFNQAMRALFMSGDMERLMVAPVSPRAVMTAKLLSRLPGTVLILMLLTIPALIAFGVSAGMGPIYYAAGTLMLLIAPLFGLSVGALISMLLVRILPVQKLEEYMGAAYIIIGLLIAVIIQIPNLMRDRSAAANAQSMEMIQKKLDLFEGLPLPSIWAGQGLAALGHGDFSRVLGGFSAYLLMTVGLFALTVLLANRLYLSGWMRIQGAGGRTRGLEEAGGAFRGRSLDSTIALKDWLLRLRDSRQVATLFAQFAVSVLVAFILLRPQGDSGLLQVMRSLNQGDDALWFLAAFSPGVVVSAVLLYVGWATFMKAAITSLSLEGKSFYLLKSAPISPRQVFRSKARSVLIPYAALVTILLMAAWPLARFSLAWTPYAWLSLLIMGGGLLTFSTAMGFISPNLAWEDVRKMSTGRSRLYNIVGALLYALLGGALVIAPFTLAARTPAAAPLFAILGLTALGAGTWFFTRWLERKAVAVWPGLGEG